MFPLMAKETETKGFSKEETFFQNFFLTFLPNLFQVHLSSFAFSEMHLQFLGSGSFLSIFIKIMSFLCPQHQTNNDGACLTFFANLCPNYIRLLKKCGTQCARCLRAKQKREAGLIMVYLEHDLSSIRLSAILLDFLHQTSNRFVAW